MPRGYTLICALGRVRASYKVPSIPSIPQIATSQLEVGVVHPAQREMFGSQRNCTVPYTILIKEYIEILVSHKYVVGKERVIIIAFQYSLILHQIEKCSVLVFFKLSCNMDLKLYQYNFVTLKSIGVSCTLDGFFAHE